MIYTITNFRKRLAELLKVKRGVYAGVDNEISNAFAGVDIEQIRNNRDMILVNEPIVFIKMRLPDRKHKLSKSDGYRLIYLVYKNIDKVVFLDIYPKNGPLQQLTISAEALTDLVEEYYKELVDNSLLQYDIATRN